MYGPHAVVRVCFFHVARNLLTAVTDYCEIVGVRAAVHKIESGKSKKKVPRVGMFMLCGLHALACPRFDDMLAVAV